MKTGKNISRNGVTDMLSPVSTTDEHLTVEEFDSFKAVVHDLPNDMLLDHAILSLSRFEARTVELRDAWQRGELSRGCDAREVWEELDRLSWVFCKASQLYRMKAIDVHGGRTAAVLPIEEQFEELAQRFAELVEGLKVDVERAPVRRLKLYWENICGVAERAAIRGKTTLALRQEGVLVQAICDYWDPGNSLVCGNTKDTTHKPR